MHSCSQTHLPRVAQQPFRTEQRASSMPLQFSDFRPLTSSKEHLALFPKSPLCSPLYSCICHRSYGASALGHFRLSGLEQFTSSKGFSRCSAQTRLQYVLFEFCICNIPFQGYSSSLPSPTQSYPSACQV